MTTSVIIRTTTGTFAMLDDGPFGDDLRNVLRGPFTLTDAVSVLTAGGFSKMPEFVFAVIEGSSMRILARGSGSAVVETTTGEVVVSADAGAATWHEEVVVDVEAVAIRFADSTVVDWIVGPDEGREAEADTTEAKADTADPEAVETDTADVEGALDCAVPDAVEQAAPEPVEAVVPVDTTTIIRSRPSDDPDVGAVQPASKPPDELTIITQASRSPATIDRPQDGRVAERSGDPTLVDAKVCDTDHPNPIDAVDCRICGSPLSAEVRSIPRPSIARIVFDDGNTIDLDRPQIIGRRPALPVLSDVDEIPGFVVIPDPHEDLSRSHLALSLDGWTLRVTDLNSTNGTTVEHPLQEPFRLTPAEPVDLVDGSKITLADVTSFVVEAPSA